MTGNVELDVIKIGYYNPVPKTNYYLTDCTCTLLKEENKIHIIDPLGSYSSKFLLEELEKRKINPMDISTVICTHGHSDHCGNLGLFPESKHIVGFDINIGEKYFENELSNGQIYQISRQIQV